jgi:hypothetical protein
MYFFLQFIIHLKQNVKFTSLLLVKVSDGLYELLRRYMYKTKLLLVTLFLILSKT